MDKSSIKKLIHQYFPGFDQSELIDRLVGDSQYVELPVGTEILNTGSYIKVVPLVLKGSIKVFREDNTGREVFLYYITPGESCAITLASCMKRGRSLIRAVVQEDSGLLAVPVDTIYEVGRKYPAWQYFVSEVFSQRFEEVLQVLESVVFHNMDERLAQYLLYKAQTLGTTTLLISHQEIADDLATSREVVSRLLKQMEKKAYIKMSRGKIALTGLPEKMPS